jgi:hypothetical protein
MAQPSRDQHHSPTQWLRRLDRAAARMNPFLMVLAIGLLALNATCFMLLAQKFPITRIGAGLQTCPVAAESELLTAPATRVSY